MLNFLKQYPILLLVIASATLLVTLSKLGILSEQSALVELTKKLHDTYGLQALFISSLIEGFLFVGMYYIGSAFIVAAVLLAQGDIYSLFQIIVTVWLALTIMSVVNFTIGRHGWLPMKTPGLPTGRWAKFSKVILYLHPTLIAFQAYTLGQTKKPYSSLVPLSAGIFLSGVFYTVLISISSSLFL